MLRTLFKIGLMAMAGIFLLKFAFGLFGTFVALMIWLVVLALKILVVGAVVYVIIRIVSPATARRMTDAFTGRPTS